MCKRDKGKIETILHTLLIQFNYTPGELNLWTLIHLPLPLQHEFDRDELDLIC